MSTLPSCHAQSRVFPRYKYYTYGLNLQTSRHLAVERGNKQNKSILLTCFHKRRILGRKYFPNLQLFYIPVKLELANLFPDHQRWKTPDTSCEFTHAVVVVVPDAPELSC